MNDWQAIADTDPRSMKNRMLSLWRQLVHISSDDPEKARLGRLFNTLMVTSFFVATGLFFTFLLATRFGYFETQTEGLIGAAFPLLFIPFSLVCLIYAKRGYVYEMARFYVWANLFGIGMASFVFDGYHSASLFLFFWPVTLAGTLLAPSYATKTSLGVILYFAALYGLERVGIYAPVINTSAESFRFLALAFGMNVLLSTAGVVNALNMSSLHDALNRLRGTTRMLEDTRRNLEQRVETRTQALQTRAEQLKVIAELNRAVASILDSQRLLENAVRRISLRMGYYHVAIYILDPARKWAVLRAASSAGGRQLLARNHRVEIGGPSVVGDVARKGEYRIVFDLEKLAETSEQMDLPEARSEVALPLITRARVIGVLDIQMSDPKGFSTADVEVLQILADGIAVAIENARLLEETQNAMENLSHYQEQEAMNAWRRSLARRNMELNYVYNSGEVHRVRPDEMPAWVKGEGLSSVTTRESEDGGHLLLAPVHIQERPVGVLSFERSVPWRNEEQQLIQFVVQQLELALDNARLLEETRLRAFQERARSEIVSRVRSLSTTDAILRSAAQELGQALQVERSRIQLLPPGEGEK